jgi:hypothetical protein
MSIFRGGWNVSIWLTINLNYVFTDLFCDNFSRNGTPSKTEEYLYIDILSNVSGGLTKSRDENQNSLVSVVRA